MRRSFEPADFVRRIGLDLVRAFEDARQATTPELVGDAMEQPVRDRLEQVLPRGIGVGSGCVIDITGATSRQMDVVLYEKEQCPVFCINNSPESTYYPAEGVLAVGEVKSRIGKRELADSFEKIRSVKCLERSYSKMKDGLYVGRRYGNEGTTAAYGFHRDHTNVGDIFGFVLAQESSLPVTLPDPAKEHKTKPRATLLRHYSLNVEKVNNDVLCPDMVVLLEGTLLYPQCAQGDLPYTPTRAKNVLFHRISPARADSPFGELLRRIWNRYQAGFTAHIPLDHYLHYEAKVEASLTWAIFANVGTREQVALKSQDTESLVTPTDHIRNDLAFLARHQA